MVETSQKRSNASYFHWGFPQYLTGYSRLTLVLGVGWRTMTEV